MKNQRKIRYAILSGCVVGLLFFVVIMTAFIAFFVLDSQYTEINHFDDISVCSQLDEFRVSKNVLIDKYIEDVEYMDSYAYKLNYDSTEFELYAYKFDSCETAKEYYLQVEGKTVDGNIDYRGRSGLFSSKLTVRYNNNVYRIETGNTLDYIKVRRFLNSVFTINIRQ